MKPLRSAQVVALAGAFAAAGLSLPGVAAAEPSGDYAVRPHATLVLADRGGVAVRQLEASVRPRGDALEVRVRGLIGRRDGSGNAHAFLQVGACTGGSTRTPACPPTAKRRVPVSLGVAPMRLEARVARPRGQLAAIQVAVTADGRTVSGPTEHAFLLLGASAWDARNAGRSFGGAIGFGGSIDVRTLRVDVVGLAPTLAAATVGLRAINASNAAGSLAVTTADARPQLVAIPPLGTFGVSEHDHRRLHGTAAALRTQLRADATRWLAKALLPWPRPR